MGALSSLLPCTCVLPDFSILLDIPGEGGGYLVYLVDGNMPVFRVSFSPLFPGTGYQSKDVFLEQVVKKGTFSLEQVIISAMLGLIFTVLSICPNLFNFLVDFAAIF